MRCSLHKDSVSGVNMQIDFQSNKLMLGLIPLCHDYELHGTLCIFIELQYCHHEKLQYTRSIKNSVSGHVKYDGREKK